LAKGNIKEYGIFTSDKINPINEFQSFIHSISNVIEWFKNFKENIYKMSIELLIFIYKTILRVVTQTPSFIFDNTFVPNTSIIFSTASIGIIIILTIVESLKQMINKKKFKPTHFQKIIKRIPISIAVSGFAPFLFQQGFRMINKIALDIIELGGNFLNGSLIENMTLTGMDAVSVLIFDVILIGLLVPIIMQNAKRWWDLFCLAAISPLAMTAWIFDDKRYLFNIWWSTIQKHSIIQLVYATFIMLMGIFIYGTRFVTPEAWSIKFLIVIGALYRLANPPNFIKSYTRGDTNIVDMFKNMHSTFSNVVNTITFKKFSLKKIGRR